MAIAQRKERGLNMPKAFKIGIIILGLLLGGCGKDDHRIVELSVYCVDIWNTKAGRITRYCATEETGNVEIEKHKKKTIVRLIDPTMEIITIPR